MSRTKFYVIYLTGFLGIMFIGFLSQLKLLYPEISFVTTIASLTFFDRYVVEYLLVLTVGIWLINGGGFCRTFCYLLSFVFIAIYGLQFSAYYQGGEFISLLAIENLNHISLVLNAPTISCIIFFLTLSGFLIFINEKKCRKIFTNKVLIISSFVLLLLGVTFHHSQTWLSQEILKQRKTYFVQNNLTRTPPARKLYKTLVGKWENTASTKLSKNDLYEAEKIGFNLSLKDKYPLLKDYIYEGPPPFKRITDTPKYPNIIVFFTEGLSARSINHYGSKYPNLTPNIDAFAKQSMTVHNYYNHTAATYRGLHGQLCSLYPKYGGEGGWQTDFKNIPKSSYLSLNKILDKYEYETVFLDSHLKDHAFIDEMMTLLRFDQVWNAEDLSRKFLNNSEPLRNDALSDVQFFDSLIGFLKSLLDRDKKTPFFIGLYNLGTHAWQDISKDGKEYKYKKNISLNSIHTLDYAFGKFWRYFQGSKYFNDTIVIFTTDHCHYPEKAFVDAFDGPNYQRIFVDKIPLIIRDPTRKLPKTYDATFATSIDFTPSLIHYLGLPNQKNPFVGASLFLRRDKNFGIASYGNEHFFIDSKKIYRYGFSEFHKEKLKLIKKMIKATQQLEYENRIWHFDIETTKRAGFDGRADIKLNDIPRINPINNTKKILKQ